MKKMILAAAILVCLPAAAVAQIAAAKSSDASGRWEAMFYTDNGQIPATIVLKKDGEKLAGTISGAQGETEIWGTQKGTAVVLSLNFETGNGTITITLNGAQDGDSMAGSADFGGQGGADWDAKRAAEPAMSQPAQAETKAKALDVSGAWVLDVSTAAGSGTPTVTLKQEGEKLTGQYSGQLGDAPVTGTLKGNAITFQFDVDVQGTALHVVYSGTVEADAMKGTVSLGEAGDGTFTGTRKK
jgi:hypothetical protein